MPIRSDYNYGNESPDARYFVPSRGELLMVVRCRQLAGNRPYASSFRAFRAVLEDNGGLMWQQLDAMDGRLIFVALGCSTSYEVTDFAECDVAEGIYFKGDMNVWSPGNWEGMTAEERLDLMDDQGVWLGPPLGPILPYFELPDQFAVERDFSPPAWIYPGN